MRSWPYPFQAGMAISNDAEFMSFEFFEELMAFLNSHTKTSLGNGLGLSVTSSVFFYSANPYNFSYFDGYNPKSSVSKYAQRIDEYIKEGWIDTIHAYGDFDGVGGFQRIHAENTFRELKKKKLSIEVYTNHGGAENWQNIGKDAEYHCGDIKEHEAYHIDLMFENGIKYIWTDSMITFKKSKKQILKDYLLNLLRKNNKKKYLINDTELQDGSIFTGFLRFRSTGLNAPNLSSFNDQITQIDWKRLYQKHSAIIIYQHLGVLCRNNGRCTAATIEAIANAPDQYLSGFYHIKREADSKKLWLCGTAELLRYIDMLRSTQIIISDKEVRLYNKNCHSNPEKFFQGLTIYLPYIQNLHLHWEDTVIPFLWNDPDDSGRLSITIPLIAKKDLWT